MAGLNCDRDRPVIHMLIAVYCTLVLLYMELAWQQHSCFGRDCSLDLMVAKLKMLSSYLHSGQWKWNGNSGSNVTHLQLAGVGYHVSEERVAGNVEGNTQALGGGREGGGGQYS